MSNVEVDAALTDPGYHQSELTSSSVFTSRGIESRQFRGVLPHIS
ncbi:hypothetical protein ACIA5D_20860 [Actinoplanes sp. NPDC051513]